MVHTLRVIVQYLNSSQSSRPIGTEPGRASIEGGKKEIPGANRVIVYCTRRYPFSYGLLQYI